MRKASDFLITRSYGVMGNFGGCRGIISKCLLSPYEFKQTFYYKMKSKTME
ncbi:hypothetical protein HPHPP8B_0230 [Helicobacter pylori Hp P-8b]|nr:hypothetical protein HPHPP8_0228 [Helicobacter pylori Hp P-8]EJC27678.1 hypothetical protein HPHPP8B_0230 [Helicobacter pylori Hp P-8b]